jgi:hypothetical protein
MYTVLVEMPSGMRSRGYDRTTLTDAQALLPKILVQLVKGYVLILQDGKEIQREVVDELS